MVIETTVVESTSTSEPTSDEKPEGYLKIRTRWWPLLLIPYLIGIAWTGLHPIVSIITGELKCRGWYIDENALDSSNFQAEQPYPVPRVGPRGEGSASLCETLFPTSGENIVPDNVSCLYHETGYFDVARLVPVSNAVEPTAEALVVVVPAPVTKWDESILHSSLLHLLMRLADSQSAPWLAKTILFVSSTKSDVPLHDTIQSFLDSYWGAASLQDVARQQPLPPTFTSGMIRNLIVLDEVIIDNNNDGPNTLQILPQGRRGVLPNMDLVFATMVTYSRASFMTNSRRQPTPVLRMHPYGRMALTWENWVKSHAPLSLVEWPIDFGNMVMFSYSLVFGPYPPHAPVLDRGIDSVTIQIRLDTQSQPHVIPEYVQRLEYLLHALSNLHERLHHSITQYLLPSPAKFVSHSEYLLPTILLLLPLVLRAALLALIQVKRLQMHAIRVAVLAVCLIIPLGLVSPHVPLSIMNGLYTVTYATVGVFASNGAFKDRKEMRQTLQFLSCLLAIYLHVPIALAHVSLAYPSALVWTPLLAVPSYHQEFCGLFWKSAAIVLLLITWPPSSLVPKLFTLYSPYVIFVYTPLHLMFCLLWVV